MEGTLNKMMMTGQHQHSNGLLQEFYAMTQWTNDPIGKFAVQLNLVAGKVCLQSRKALGSSKEERGRLLINHLLRSMNPKLRGHVVHMVNGKAILDRPDYWQLVKFTVKKEAKINFDDAKKVLKPKATTHFKVAVRVTHASEAFSGRCFHCNKVGHHFQDEECEMYDPDFLNLKGDLQGPAQTDRSPE